MSQEENEAFRQEVDQLMVDLDKEDATIGQVLQFMGELYNIKNKGKEKTFKVLADNVRDLRRHLRKLIFKWSDLQVLINNKSILFIFKIYIKIVKMLCLYVCTYLFLSCFCNASVLVCEYVYLMTCSYC